MTVRLDTRLSGMAWDGDQPNAPDAETTSCSVGIMAYNEEANIASAINTILPQRLASGRIDELIVVASGCTDRTAEIVAKIAKREPRVRLIVQPRREGKASAINLFIEAARSPVLLMVGADVLVEEGTIEAMVRNFDDPTVGMVGGHAIPVNDETRFLGYAAHLLWRLHDRLAREAPKLGEIVSFRNVVPSLPVDTSVDEISLQALITQLGYRTVYEPKAIVYNRGPGTVRDFVRQRRRIFAGHLRVRKQQGYAASTMSIRRIGRAFRGSGAFSSLRAVLWTMCTIALEATARALGRYDFVRRHSHHVWRPISTTKRYIAEGAIGQLQPSVLVFHIVNFHRQQLEFGMRASKQMAGRVLQYIRLSLGPNSQVSVQRGGTIIAVIPAPREEAERIAGEIVRGLDDGALDLHDSTGGPTIRLACGIIAFSFAGQAAAGSVQAAGLAPGDFGTGLDRRLDEALSEAV
ncbi:MAG: glycosyltransferase [Chloroflexi bacterium]|nr:MAG: glycosyltransferase [Chloroflexota bacterium]